MATIADMRPSPIAGTWYPAEPERLSQEVDGYLKNAVIPERSGEVVAVIAPHAGHIYSGATAGHAFGWVRGKTFPRVALLAPMHSYYPAPFITSAHKAYQTPLGPVWIDRQAVQALAQAMQARSMPELIALARDNEHALEIELPFLQRALSGDFQLVPLMVRTHNPRELQKMGEALAETLRQYPALLVASSDLSHFYPVKIANQLDARMLAEIERFSPEGVLTAEENGDGHACGAGAIAAVLWAARAMGADTVEIVHHSTSADQTGDESSVVGYGAAVILKKG